MECGDELWATIKTDILGDLEIKNIGLFYGEPIVFMCESKNKHNYMGLVTKPLRQYILTSVTQARYQEILTNKISIREAIKNSERSWVYMCKLIGDILICDVRWISQLNNNLLPDDKLYFYNDNFVEPLKRISKAKQRKLKHKNHK